MVWLMEGLSSQRGIIRGIKEWIAGNNILATNGRLKVIASHRQFRPEITDQADISLHEPSDDQQRLAFIADTIVRYSVSVIHVGRNCCWFESHRQYIESQGVQLITGAHSVESFHIAQHKSLYTALMAEYGIPYTPAVLVETLEQLELAMPAMRLKYNRLCIKPDKGIYGNGYWQFDDDAAANQMLLKPEARRIHPQVYLDAMRESGGLPQPMILMPWLPGPEASIDMVVEKGEVIAALGRSKNGPIQTLFSEGEEIEIARRCISLLQADGLVNVQTCVADDGSIRLLECNLRPSGGVFYGMSGGVNLPAIMIASRLGYPRPAVNIISPCIRIIDTAVPIQAKARDYE